MGETCPLTSQTLCFHMRTIWLQNAFSDPCLFHTILFYASAQIDNISCGTNRNPITLYHHSQALNRINQRLSANGAIVDDNLVASIALLAMHASVANNAEAMKIHIRGLMTIVRSRGGLKNLGLAGSLVNMVYMAKIFSSILNTEEMLGLETASSCSPPAPLLQAIIRRVHLKSAEYENADQILSLFLEVYAAVPRLQDFITGKRSLCEWRDARRLTTGTRPSRRATSPELGNNDSVLWACELAVAIFWYLVDGTSALETETLDDMFLDLKLALNATDIVQWMSFSQEALIWICAVGAAISQSAFESWWFVMQGASMVMCTNLIHGSIFEESWFAFKWMRQLHRLRIVK
ncbi:uncharacterized protein BO97DRAFT_479506 [Aspergillus homomorphus CBS 101889]|uniref:C6 transcription factor n=1 Tax=Aspergillus homomorphus (strain CBS 101889) TaxID=1450537 RepID=A0A395HRR7_ASPHC|nr:hypothetical protein BO97DRAFT_479506 [Aspergillus homomorphus CBS 101889]RAL10035.1 hypothetical protein BO97DRAFT_479506 [Aspergillus homomorphus CBS 101889]